MVTAFQNAQVLLLAAVLLAACLAKLAVREPAAAGGTTHVHGVPLRVTALRRRRSAAVGVAAAEGVLGLALLVTSHLSVRVATAVAFAVATWAVSEMRTHRPDAGCGCFGGLSDKRVGRRSVARAMLFTGAAIAALSAPLAGMDVLRAGTAQVGLVVTVELALFAALSPELGTLVRRLLGRQGGRPRVPCARRRGTLGETYATLHDSDVWAAYENLVMSAVPLDVWREGCWRFLVYPARFGEREVEIVFAVSTAERDRMVRSAVLEREGTAGAGLSRGFQA
ncbi:hypothetical protein GCM10009678_07380 [Actinomadura kijaniata]|uniref:Methylamine utilisation protein MauE domain-containing protein n=1 Tax=Actinomadura namibiensis TaxID=182080 RepID=A0A7W3LLL9_ACTNM|nr:MauE/DoxX family redox-associated membrane protein [Actinomadura namibiensis]MBA8950295.1 hypothetical protein [Actinomadura namibiensis]